MDQKTIRHAISSFSKTFKVDGTTISHCNLTTSKVDE